MKGHPEKAKEFLKNKEKVAWHDKTIWLARTNRDSAASRVPEWEELRDLASNIKEHLLSRLDEYLEEFENNAAANGVKVHWAKDGKAHNEIVRRIIEEKKARRIVKSKSILTEECGMNHELEALGFEVVDTDLGERIIQFARQRPSHIVAPAIHLSSEEISEIFHEALNTEKGNEDPQYLTETARQHLREKFFSADIAMTGVNFAVAETGAFVVCTNEGNADMGVHLADVHIASMSIEKLVPKTEHLGVMLRLLARSATGQFITTYTSHFRRPKPGQEMHIVIVDNGRSDHLGLTDFRAALKCIRCGACLNTCPVYRRSGGYSYDYTIPGPLGSVLAPRVHMKNFASMPFASTLCGSCTDVCPVKIDLHEQLYKWRKEIVNKGAVPVGKRLGMWLAGQILGRAGLYRVFGKAARFMLLHAPRFMIYNSMNTWGKTRELPRNPGDSFSEWYKKNKKEQ